MDLCSDINGPAVREPSATVLSWLMITTVVVGVVAEVIG